MTRVLERLDRLEQQNHELLTEVRSLRTALAAKDSPAQPLEDRVAVVESRVEEQAQSKLEAAQRFPVTMKGMVLFNAFANTQAKSPDGVYADLVSGVDRSGATLLQTQLGLDFHGPELPGNGRLSGSLNLDFYGSPSAYTSWLRLRRAAVNFDWADRSFSVGQEKPLLSRRSPDSLAEVATPPLANSGNPWVWVPQARYAEHIHLSEQNGIEAEASVLQTSENYDYDPYAKHYVGDLNRPGFETRVAFWHAAGNTRFEIAPGFHTSTSHIYGYSVPSRFGTIDYLIRPAKWIEITGLILGGQNTSVLGGFSDGFLRHDAGAPSPVREIGGWTQFSFPLTSRLTLNAFGGLQAPQTRGLTSGALTHSAAFATNLRYRLAPNLLIGVEALQSRDGYQSQPHVIRNHYDVALGYLF